MGCTACTEPHCLYKGALYLTVELYLYSPLWAVRSVQSLSACTRVHFTLQWSYTFTPPMGRTACTEHQCLYKGVHFTYNSRVTFYSRTDIRILLATVLTYCTTKKISPQSFKMRLPNKKYSPHYR